MDIENLLKSINSDYLDDWLFTDGLEQLLLNLNSFLNSEHILVYQDELPPNAYKDLEKLRVQLNTYQSIKALSKLKESLQ